LSSSIGQTILSLARASRFIRMKLTWIVPLLLPSPSRTFHSDRRNNRFYLSALTSMTSNNVSSDPVVELGLPSPIVLGSGSSTRKMILAEMNINFVVKVKSIDEKSIGQRTRGSDPQQLVLTLAKAKADSLTRALLETDKHFLEASKIHDERGCIVLTADQVVTHGGEILEKPDSHQQAMDFVHRYAALPPATVGSIVLTHIPSMTQVAGVDVSHIYFRQSIATCDLIPRLVQDGAPVLDCAGGLMIEHPMVREHLDHIEGSEDGVMGLSKTLVLRLLQELQQSLNR
jgi:septum formation protein